MVAPKPIYVQLKLGEITSSHETDDNLLIVSQEVLGNVSIGQDPVWKPLGQVTQAVCRPESCTDGHICGTLETGIITDND